MENRRKAEKCTEGTVPCRRLLGHRLLTSDTQIKRGGRTSTYIQTKLTQHVSIMGSTSGHKLHGSSTPRYQAKSHYVLNRNISYFQRFKTEGFFKNGATKSFTIRIISLLKQSDLLLLVQLLYLENKVECH
jgi:hypothetical protein